MNRGSEALAPDAARKDPPTRGNQRAAARRLDGALSIVALTILLVCVFYAFSYPLLGHYPGMSLTYDWEVLDTDACDPALAWCRANNGHMLRGDHVLQIGDLTYAAYVADRTAVPFGAFTPGSSVPIILQRNGQARQVQWVMPDSTSPAWNMAFLLVS